MLITTSCTPRHVGGISFNLSGNDQAMMSKQSVINLVAYIKDLRKELVHYEAHQKCFNTLGIVEWHLGIFLVHARTQSPQYLLELRNIRTALDNFYAVTLMEYEGLDNKIFIENISSYYFSATYEIGSLRDNAMVGSSVYAGSIPMKGK